MKFWPLLVLVLLAIAAAAFGRSHPVTTNLYGAREEIVITTQRGDIGHGIIIEDDEK